MKQIKKIALALCLSAFAAGNIGAQDLGQATELYNMGATALSSENNESALNYFKQALEMAETLGDEGFEIVNDSKNIIPKIYLQIGKEAASGKDFEKAFANLELAKTTAEEYGVGEVTNEVAEVLPQVYMMKGNGLLNEGKYQDAIEAYSKVTELNPTDGVAHLRLGMCYSKTGNEEKAIEAFNNASANGKKIDAEKQMAQMYLLKANSSFKSKDYTTAVAAALTAIEIAPKNATAYKLLGASALAGKDFDNAIKGFEGYLSVSPNAKDKNAMIYQTAVAYEGKGDVEKACGYYRQIASDPKFGEYAKHKINTELKCK